MNPIRFHGHPNRRGRKQTKMQARVMGSLLRQALRATPVLISTSEVSLCVVSGRPGAGMSYVENFKAMGLLPKTSDK